MLAGATGATADRLISWISAPVMGFRTRDPLPWMPPAGRRLRARKPTPERLESRLLLSGPGTLAFTGTAETVVLSDVDPLSLPAGLFTSNASGGVEAFRGGIFSPPPAEPSVVAPGPDPPPSWSRLAVPGPRAEFLGMVDGPSDPVDWAASVDAPGPGTALVLPEESDLTVRGAIEAVKGGPTYSVPLDPGVQAVRIEMRPGSPTVAFADGIMVFDEAGRKLVQCLPDPGTHTIRIDLVTADLLRTGIHHRALYLQIFLPASLSSAGTGTAAGRPANFAPMAPGGPSAAGFLLSIQRKDIPSASSGDGPVAVSRSAPADTTPGAVFTVMTTLPTEPPASPPVARRAPTGPDATDPAAPTRVATGPLPTRAAAPLGGALAGNSDPAPAVPRGDTEAVDLALSDLALGAGARPLDPDQAVPVPATTRGALVAQLGPGGFPLLGTSLIAEGQMARLGIADRLPITSFARTSLPATGSGPMSREAPPEAKASSRPCGTVRRLSALTGAALALVFLSGVILPGFADSTRTHPKHRSWVRRFLPPLKARVTSRAPTT